MPPAGRVATLGAFFSLGLSFPGLRKPVSSCLGVVFARMMLAVLVLSDRLCLKVGGTKWPLLSSSIALSLKPGMMLLDLDRVRLSLSLTPPHRGARNPDVDDIACLWPLIHALPPRDDAGAVEVLELLLLRLLRLPGWLEVQSGAFQSRANWRSYSGVPSASGPR